MSRIISLEAFLAQLDAIAASSPSYRLGGDGSDGTCDCIGLIIGALRRAGGSWTGIHGSNYAARHETTALQPIASASRLSVGQVVYKAHAPGVSGYALPSRYAAHLDQLDYYHAGVVRSTSPLEIIHCTSPGIVRDSKLGKWSHHGWLTSISSQGGTPMPLITTTATVCAASGSTVNLRTSPNGPLLDRIPVGAAVTVTEQASGWSRITCNGLSGWMKDEYLSTASDATMTLTLPLDAARQLQAALAAALEKG